MTDEEGLLAAILREPADDLPRLVYADWLDEQAEGALTPRAEFIRDSLWMSANYTDCPYRLEDVRRGRPVPLRCGRCEYCLARRRCEQFYAKHRWVEGANYAVCFEPTPLDGSDFPTGDGLTLIVRRGFVSEVRCPLVHFLAHADALCRMPLTTIRLSDRVPALFRDTVGEGYGWMGTAYYTAPDEPPDALPMSLVELLSESNPPVRRGTRKRWPTPDLAHVALSTAICAYLTQRRKAATNG